MFEALLLFASLAGETADPLAPAREGKIQCVTPDRVKKTCSAITSYAAKADGSWRGTSSVMLPPAPQMTLITESDLNVEDGAICGLILREDFEASKMLMNGTPMPPEQAQPIIAQLLMFVAPMIGQKACTRVRPEADVLVSETTLNGVARPELAQRFIWVKPDEGYRVGT